MFVRLSVQEKPIETDSSCFEQPKKYLDVDPKAFHQIEFVPNLKCKDFIDCNQSMFVLTNLLKNQRNKIK